MLHSVKRLHKLWAKSYIIQGQGQPLPGKGLPLNSHNGQDKQAQITIELRKGAISMVVSWPVHAAADLASWSTAVLT